MALSLIQLQNGTDIEIVKATGNSSTTITIVRAQEGTTGLAFPNGATVSLRPTADSVDRKEDLITARVLPNVTAASDDKVLIQDTSNGDTLSTVTVTSLVTVDQIVNWQGLAGTSQLATDNTGWIIQNGSQTTVTLPATAPIGSLVAIQGLGAGGWKMTANTGQNIQNGSSSTSSGGSLTSANRWDSVEVICVIANLTWSVTRVLSSGLTIT